jgi:hypothetical protein
MQLSTQLLHKDYEQTQLMLRHYQKLLLTNKPNKQGRRLVLRQIARLQYRLTLSFLVAA